MKVLAALIALVAVASAAPRFSTWSSTELSEAIQNPSTDPAILPYLIDALNQYMDALWAGQQPESIIVATPVGVIPSPSAVAEIAPVSPAIVPEVPVVQPVPAAVQGSSPLVQIIVNVKADQQQVAPSPAVVPEVLPEPVIVVEQPEEALKPEPVITPEPVIVVEQPAETTVPEPIEIGLPIIPVVPEGNPIDVIAVTAPEHNPIDVIAVTAPEHNPIDVIAVTAPEHNPIDVVAVGAPEVNPVDLISPVPVVAAGGAEGILV